MDKVEFTIALVISPYANGSIVVHAIGLIGRVDGGIDICILRLILRMVIKPMLFKDGTLITGRSPLIELVKILISNGFFNRFKVLNWEKFWPMRLT